MFKKEIFQNTQDFYPQQTFIEPGFACTEIRLKPDMEAYFMDLISEKPLLFLVAALFFMGGVSLLTSKILASLITSTYKQSAWISFVPKLLLNVPLIVLDIVAHLVGLLAVIQVIRFTSPEEGILYLFLALWGFANLIYLKWFFVKRDIKSFREEAKQKIKEELKAEIKEEDKKTETKKLKESSKKETPFKKSEKK